MKVGLVVFVIYSLFATGGFAQEVEQVELTNTQLELNNEAIEALEQSPPEPEKALSLINAALVSGPDANLLYITLGRVYQSLERCPEAFEAYETAAIKPGILGIPDEQIQIRLRTYVDELEETCPGELLIECVDPATELYVEGLEAVRCDIPLEASPGTYRIEATVEGMSTAVNVELRGGAESVVEIGLDGGRLRLGRALERGLRRVDQSVDRAEHVHAVAFEELQDQRIREQQRRRQELAIKERERAAAEKAASRNTFVGAVFGGNVGYIGGNNEPTAAGGFTIDRGLSMAPGHLRFDLGRAIGKTTFLGGYFRWQLLPSQDFDIISEELGRRECFGVGLSGDCLLGLSIRRFLGDEARGAYLSAGFGVGRLRHMIKLQQLTNAENPGSRCEHREINYDPDLGDYCEYRDTARSGPFHVGGGFGAVRSLGSNAGLVFEFYPMFLFPARSVSFDASVGLHFLF